MNVAGTYLNKISPDPNRFEKPIIWCAKDSNFLDTNSGRFLKFVIYFNNSNNYHTQLIPVSNSSNCDHIYNEYYKLCVNLNVILNRSNRHNKVDELKSLIQNELSNFLKNNYFSIEKHYRPLHFIARQCLKYFSGSRDLAQDEPLINSLIFTREMRSPSQTIGLSLLDSFSTPLAKVAAINSISTRRMEDICTDLQALIRILKGLYEKFKGQTTPLDFKKIISEFQQATYRTDFKGFNSNNRSVIAHENWLSSVLFICLIFIQDLISQHLRNEQTLIHQAESPSELANHCAKIFYTFLKVKDYTNYDHSKDPEILLSQCVEKWLHPDQLENKVMHGLPALKADYLAFAYLARDVSSHLKSSGFISSKLDYFSNPELAKEIENALHCIDNPHDSSRIRGQLVEFEELFISHYFGSKALYNQVKENLIMKIREGSILLGQEGHHEQNLEIEFSKFANEAFPELNFSGEEFPENPFFQECTELSPSQNEPISDSLMEVEVTEPNQSKLQEEEEDQLFAKLIEGQFLSEPDSTDFDKLTLDVYLKLPKKTQQAVCKYCEKLAKVVQSAIRGKNNEFPHYREGLSFAILENLSLPLDSQLPEKSQKACQEHVLHFAGLLSKDDCLARYEKYKSNLLEPTIANQTEKLLWHLKNKEIQYIGNHLEESLKQKEKYGLECSVPLFFIYQHDDKIVLLSFSAIFIEGSMVGFVKGNPADAVQILNNLDISSEPVAVLGDHQGYQISREDLLKLQNDLLKASNEPKPPPFLIFERKRSIPPRLRELKRRKRKRIAVIEPSASTRAPKRRRTTHADTVTSASVSQPEPDSFQPKKKKSSTISTATPSLFSSNLAFWNLLSLNSSEAVSKKVSECAVANQQYKPLGWDKILLKRLKDKSQTTSSYPPIWRLKPYQQKALERMADLNSKGLSALLCFDMGLGKTITYASKIARFIADGNQGDILVFVPPATEEQTYNDLIDSLTEAQYTGALFSLQHLKEFGTDEKSVRINEIIKFIKRCGRAFCSSNDQVLIKRHERRKEMIRELISMIPKEYKSQLESFIHLNLWATESSSSSTPEISSSYPLDQFLRIMNFCPDQNIEPIAKKKDNGEQKIFIATYPKLQNLNLREYLGLIIFDEAQLIHTSTTARVQAAERLVNTAREKNKNLQVLHSTGTPFENNLLELFTLINLAIPGFIPATLINDFSSLLKEAKKYLHHPESIKCKEAICQAFIQFHVLTSILKNLFIHKLKTDQDVKDDWKGAIPDKIITPIKIDLNDPIISNEAWEKLKSIRSDFAQHKNLKNTMNMEYAALNHKDLKSAKTEDAAFDELLARVTSHPQEELRHSPIISALINSTAFKQAVNDKQDSLFFVYYRATAQLLKTFLQKLHPEAEVVIFNGDTSFEEREKIIKKFQIQNNQKPRLLIISLKTGGVGLNFPLVKNAFFLTGSYNPAVQTQAEDRIVRAGNEGSRSIFRFNLGTIGEKHLETIHRKKKRQSRFLFSKHLQQNEIDFNVNSLSQELRQFIKMLVYEKTHQDFKKENTASPDELIENLDQCVGTYFVDNAELFEKRFRFVHPFTAMPETCPSVHMEVDSQPALEPEESSAEAVEKGKKLPLEIRSYPKNLSLKDYLMVPCEGGAMSNTLRLGRYISENKNEEWIRTFLSSFDRAQQRDSSIRACIRDKRPKPMPKEVCDFYTKLKTHMPILPDPHTDTIIYGQLGDTFIQKRILNGSKEGEPFYLRESENKHGFDYYLLIPKSWF